MMYRASFLVGAVVGYVLGTKAGQERYEQIKQMSRRVAEHPRVQETAGVLRAQAEGLAGNAKEKVSGKVHKSPETETETVPPSPGGDGGQSSAAW